MTGQSDESGVASGKCSGCPRILRLTGDGRIVRHKRLAGASSYGDSKVQCEGSGVAPARVISPEVTR